MAKKVPEYELEPKHFAILPIAATEQSRYAINALKLEPGGRAIVTDGKRLLVSVVKADAGVKELMVDRPECECAQAMQAAAKSKTVAVSGDEKMLTIRAKTLTATTERPGAFIKFPRWPDALPTDEPEVGVAVNAKLLGELLLAVAAQFQGDCDPLVHLGLPHPDASGERSRPLVIWTDADSVANCLGVLMPCSGTCDEPRTWQEARAALVEDERAD